MTESLSSYDTEIVGLEGVTSIEVEPDRDGDFISGGAVTWQPTTDVAAPHATARNRERRMPLTAREAVQSHEGGILHVITAAARTPGVGLVAAHEGFDFDERRRGLGLADGMAVRVVTRLDRHEVRVPGATTGDSPDPADQQPLIVILRYLPAAAVTNPRCSLGVVLPDDWNAMVGAGAGYSVNGLEHEVNLLEAIGFKIRHRLYVQAGPSTMAVHFGSLAERVDLYPVARDILRAGGMIQIEAGAMTPLDAVAAVGIAPWAGWVNRFDMTIVVPCTPRDAGWRDERTGLISGPVLDSAADIAALASEAVRAAGGPAMSQAYPSPNIGLALVDAHKLVPGVAGWTTESAQQLHTHLDAHERGEGGTVDELAALINAVQDACDGEVDVELVGTGPDTLIDLR